MNKLIAFIGAIAVAGMIAGCVTGGAGEDKVAKWQCERTPVEVLKSSIADTSKNSKDPADDKAVAAVFETLDIVPFGLYKAVADKVDKAAVLERYRRIYLGYVGDVKGLEEQGKSREEARKAVMEQILKQPDGTQTVAKLNAYLKFAKESNFEAIEAWIKTMGEELKKAGEKLKEQSPIAMEKLAAIAQNGDRIAAMRLAAKGRDDIAVIGAQLADAGKGLALYVEIVNAYKEAAKMQADYPVEG